jgi:hypothetical protein
MSGDCGNTWSAKDHSTGGKPFICRSSVSPLRCPAALDRLKRDGEAPGSTRRPPHGGIVSARPTTAFSQLRRLALHEQRHDPDITALLAFLLVTE